MHYVFVIRVGRVRARVAHDADALEEGQVFAPFAGRGGGGERHGGFFAVFVVAFVCFSPRIVVIFVVFIISLEDAQNSGVSRVCVVVYWPSLNRDLSNLGIHVPLEESSRVIWVLHIVVVIVVIVVVVVVVIVVVIIILCFSFLHWRWCLCCIMC